MAKLRGSTDSKLIAINATLMLAVVTAADHAELVRMILAIIESNKKSINQR